MPSDRVPVRVLIVLAIGQLVGWGSVGCISVIGAPIAAELGMDLPTVFAGNSVLYGVMGLCAPVLGPAYVRHGARRVLIAGSVLAGPGFVLMAMARGPVAYFAAWVLLGAAGSAILTTAAHVLLNEIAGRGARRSIGGLMLMTGLSSSLFRPATALLADLFGWRAACLAYAGTFWFLCIPLNLYGLPRRGPPAIDPGFPPPPPAGGMPSPGTFRLIATGSALHAFISFGLGAILIELLIERGLSRPEAIAYGSALGVVQVSARGLDFLGRGRWDGLTTGLIAGPLVAASLILLVAAGSHPLAPGAFTLLYGLGSGALAVARATLPMVFYDGAAYARAAARIALPLNLATASAPPILAGMLTAFGGDAMLLLTAGCSVAATAAFAALARRRPGAADPPALRA